jgi:hypothetical protein
MFSLDFLLKFSTSRLILLYLDNLYNYVKYMNYLKLITSKIF